MSPTGASTQPSTAAAATTEPTTGTEVPEVEQDLLVEDVSIDGMCGVY